MANPIGLFAFPNLTGSVGGSTGGNNVWPGTNDFQFIRLNASDTFTNAVNTSGILFGTTCSAVGIEFLTATASSGSGVRTRATSSGWLLDVRSNSASWTNALMVALDKSITMSGPLSLNYSGASFTVISNIGYIIWQYPGTTYTDYSNQHYIRAAGAGSAVLYQVDGATGAQAWFGATPVTRPTGVAVSAAGIHAALVSLGLIAA